MSDQRKGQNGRFADESVESWRLVNGECRTEMAKIWPGSIDLAIPDPPYNISQEGAEIERFAFEKPSARRKAALTQDFGEWDRMTPEDYESFMADWIKLLCPLMREGGVVFIFGALESMGDMKRWGEAAGLRWVQGVIWKKKNPPPLFQATRRLIHACEAIGFLCKGHVGTWHLGSKHHNLFETPICQGKERSIHPTQKPLRLINQLVEGASNPGDLVFDPFAGSGTSMESAVRLGRRALGIERDPKYYEIAERRLRAI